MRAWISATRTGCWGAPGALCRAVVAPVGMVAAPRWLLWWPWMVFGGPAGEGMLHMGLLQGRGAMRWGWGGASTLGLY